MFLLKLGLRPWRESFFTQIFMSVAVGFLLFTVCFLYWLQDSLDPVVSRLNADDVMTVYLDASVSVDEETQIVDSIKYTVGASPEKPVEITVVNAEDFINEITE